jgi:VanZ family protein
VRHLRRIAAFKIGARTVVVTLMIVGSWVATRDIEFPPGFSISDKVIHAVVFFGFAVLMDLAVSRHPFWLWKGLPLLIYGASIEIMQYFSPERSFSVLDWLADFSGILLYFMIKMLVLWVDSKRSSSL